MGVIAMVICLAGKIATVGLLGGNVLHVVVNSLSLIMDLFLGVWVLKDDPSLAGVYHFFAVTCCNICATQCPGGLGCLLPFMVYNIVNILVAILIDGVIRDVVITAQQMIDG